MPKGRKHSSRKTENTRYFSVRARIYPTKEQEVQFQKTFGCCRKYWNLSLADRILAWKEAEFAFQPTPAMYKSRYPFLKEVDSTALSNVQMQQEQAFRNFFSDKKHFGYPKFKSKKSSRKSFTSSAVNANIRLEGNGLRLPKIKEPVSIHLHRSLPEDTILKKVTISQNSCGNYWASLCLSYEKEIIPKENLEQNVIGLDYKSDGLYTDSEGKNCGSPKYFRKSQSKLAKAQKKLSRKKGSQKGERKSQSWKKQHRKVSKIHQHIANQRKDFLHKESTRIANEYDLVCVEDLSLKAMSSAKGLRHGKVIADNGYSMFVSMLEYKLENRGKKLIRVGRFFASTQICSDCGAKNLSLKGIEGLSVREWVCPECGCYHNRDINAALNIRNEGIRIYQELME